MKTSDSAASSATLSFPLDNRTFTVKREIWKVSDLKLDPANPRLGYVLRMTKKGQMSGDKDLHAIIWDMDTVKDLFQSIYQNGGLLEDPIIRDDGKVVEGNCRTVCLRELCKKYPDDERFRQVYVRVLPKDVTEEQLMVLLGELHIAGKIEWRAYDQAEYVWRMNKQYGKNFDYLASHLRWSRSKLAQKIAAYEESKAYMERTGDKDAINRFSHFEELMKKKELRDRREKDPKFMVKFGEWVNKNKFPDAKDVRNLPQILESAEAVKKLEKEGIRQAQQVIYETNPSLVSNLYSAVDDATVQLESVPLTEITALQNGDSVKVGKIKRLVKAIRKLAEIAQVRFD